MATKVYDKAMCKIDLLSMFIELVKFVDHGNETIYKLKTAVELTQSKCSNCDIFIKFNSGRFQK